jgi:hypothetical protein
METSRRCTKSRRFANRCIQTSLRAAEEVWRARCYNFRIYTNTATSSAAKDEAANATTTSSATAWF